MRNKINRGSCISNLPDSDSPHQLSRKPISMDDIFDDDSADIDRERPWTGLTTTFDIEAWIDHTNRDLQRLVGKVPAPGAGVCFRLDAGGTLYLHTTSEGEVLLDVTPEAEWVTPLIAAATGLAAKTTTLWVLPDHVLTQLILGLSPLIASTQLVVRHAFDLKKLRTYQRF